MIKRIFQSKSFPNGRSEQVEKALKSAIEYIPTVVTLAIKGCKYIYNKYKERKHSDKAN